MPTEMISLVADTIDGAAEQIIHLLESVDNRRDVIYCQGFFGFGASAILKAVVKRLRSPSRLAYIGTAKDLGKIIHIDVSQWQSKRALQKAIAEELELHQQVMALFDQHDEEDDFDGVEQSARGVIPYVKVAIMNELMAGRFLVVLHNGSGSYIDLWEAGVPVIGQLSRRVLWTSRGRFWHPANDGDLPEFELDNVESAKWSDTAIEIVPSQLFEEDEDEDEDEDAKEVAKYTGVPEHIYEEAKEVAKYTGVPEPDMSPEMVIECILYRALRDDGDKLIWEAHASNYWVCDGIIQDGTDGGRSAWEISDALQRNMSLDFCSAYTGTGMLRAEQFNRWVSVTNENSSMKVQLTSQATSFFCTSSGTSVDHSRTRVLEAGMFDGTTSLHVIHLSHCTFSFSSPPFLSCSNLRFLLLDHCKNMDALGLGEEKERHWQNHYSNQGNGSCFQNLWVLDLSYTDWYWLLSKDMLDLMVDLRELNVKGVGNQSTMHLHHCSGAGSNRRRIIKLRVVADDSNDDGTGGKQNQQVSFFPDLSSWHILKTVILDGCSDLEQIDCNALPLSLESFALNSSVTTSSKIKGISFQGHTRLKSILLRGLFDSLVELDMSGTAIRTLDLSATQAWGLRRLFLLGCEKLCAILWPPHEENKKIRLEILRIDTTTTTYAAWDREGKSNKQEATASDSASSISIGSSPAVVYGKDRTIIDSDSYISIRDPRLFRSLVSLRHRKSLHVEVSSTGPSHKGTDQGINTSGCGGSTTINVHKPGGSLYADDEIISTSSGSNSQADDDALLMGSKWLWGCPPMPEDSDWVRCYISIQDEAHTEKLLLEGGSTTLPALVRRDSETLHLHDSLSITCLPGPALVADKADTDWDLKWCRLERCPNLRGAVFNVPQQGPGTICWSLETFWASQLPNALYIWDWSAPFRPLFGSFRCLVFLHLDYCPRLVHVLPLYTSNPSACSRLETLEIVCCGDLREVFPFHSEPRKEQQSKPREFPALKRIHLYELPKLQRICGRRMLAPNLETVKVRGCWSLRRLPAIGRRRSMQPVVACEKDWWDGLEWDGESAGHHPSHYKPKYSAYYKKKKQLRASVLR